ncbi:GMC oxidoreductase [Calocera cornea HHB12733]|uniref:GMC oxidoreductase n=1 Tax=Calocera cornea HHB12733 TaxID=1353952 RepID=A0A165IFB4_9BASI|nr:GMC oxidoreductase [Calocera cornea HHB12733]
MGFLFSKPSPLKSFSWLESKEGQSAGFDVIIIGSGPAGCVLANRLSEDGKHRVLLVEAGVSNEKETFTKIPATWPKNITSPIDWQYYTAPQENLDGRKLSFPRGKVLGGSSSINALMYHHGAPSDYDAWENEGAPGWGYKEISRYLKKAEHHTPHAKHGDAAHRGTDGPFHTGFHWPSPIVDPWIKSFESLGVPYTPDLNTPKGTMGATTFSTFVDPKGHRSSGATAYLTPDVLARPNLTVLVTTRCTRVLLDGTRAVGVELADENKHENTRKVYVSGKGEIILSAGAINTPQLLMLSGLGPKKELDRVGIECRVDLPAVGQNLQDHPCPALRFRMKPGKSLDWLATSPMAGLPHLLRWMMGWKGIMSWNGAGEAAFIRTDDPLWGFDKPGSALYHSNANPSAPDMELMSAPMTFVNHGQFVRPWFNGLSILPYVLQPASRGSLTLKSKDPFEYPIIDPNYFSVPDDLQCMIRGVRVALRVARTSPLAELFDFHAPLPDPNACTSEEEQVYAMGDCREEDLSDGDIEKWVKRNVETVYHPVCTARIGKTAVDSVVDTELRVHGVDRLRVCDASVFPRIISGHPTAPIIAISEKGAEIIGLALGQRV